MDGEDGIRSMRCYDVNIREMLSMFSIIVLRKILDSIQIARLLIASYPLPPCCITVRHETPEKSESMELL